MKNLICVLTILIIQNLYAKDDGKSPLKHNSSLVQPGNFYEHNEDSKESKEEEEKQDESIADIGSPVTNVTEDNSDDPLAEKKSQPSPVAYPELGMTSVCGSYFYNPSFATCLDGKVVSKKGAGVNIEDIQYNFNTSPPTITLNGFDGVVPMHVLTKLALRGYTNNELKALEGNIQKSQLVPPTSITNPNAATSQSYQEELPTNFFTP